MNIKISNLKDENLNENEIEILIKSLTGNEKELIEYIKNFSNKLPSKMLVNSNNILEEIKYEDIIYFYSDKKYNYCKTKDKVYKIKSKLYEIEKINPDFIRISKSCIANFNHIECFDISETGKIIIKFTDGTKEYVSRRKVKSIMDFLDERSI